MNAFPWLSTALLVFIGGSGGESFAQSAYKEISMSGGGTLRGSVRLACELPKKMQLEVSKDEKYCGVSKPSPRLRVGRKGGIGDAIVWLEGISEGKENGSGDRQIVLDQVKCEYRPHILLMPIGSALNIVNSDPILHNVHAYDDQKTLFNIAQPIKGQRTTVKNTQFRKPGLYLATCDAGHPWMNAYIMVSDHPYYALTDDNGDFVLENIPAGTYTLKMWHEGVAVVKTEMENGKAKAYAYESPYEAEKDVTVPAGGKVDVEFPFLLRSATSKVSSN